MIKKCYQKLFLVALCLFAFTVQSQIVNIESKRPGKSEQGWHGDLDLSFSWTRNTNDVLSYGGRTNNQFLKNRHRLLFLADINRVQAGGDDFVNMGYEHVRYNYNLDKEGRVAVEAFQQAQFNAIQLIAFRHLSGAGLRWSPINGDTVKLWGGTLPMFEYEELTTGIIERNMRQSTYILFLVGFEKFEFQTINYYQPKWSDISDYRFSSANTLEFGVLDWLRFTTSFNLLYDSNPPATVPPVVFTLKNGIRLEF